MPKVTEEHVAARRRQILSAAVRCFARDGFHRTTMQDIFRESGLSPGAVYTYFSGKDEIVRAVIRELMSFLGRTAALLTEPLPDGRQRRPGEAVAEVIERYRQIELGTLEERTRVFPHLVGEQQRDPELNAAVRAGVEQLRGGFEALARGAQERGELDGALDPAQVGRLAISLVQGALLQHAVFGNQLDLEEYARAAVTLIDGEPR